MPLPTSQGISMSHLAVECSTAPEGYEEWSIGTLHHARLADYSKGKEVELVKPEEDFLDCITDPELGCIIQEEFWPLYGRNILTVYIPESKAENRWGKLKAGK